MASSNVGKAIVPFEFDADQAKKDADKAGQQIAQKAGEGAQKEAPKQGKAIGEKMSDGMAQGISTSKAVVIGAIAAVTTAGIAGIASATSKVLERELASDKLAAQIGLSPSESARIGKIAGKLYGGAYGEGLTEVNSAFRGIQNNIGSLSKFSDEALESMGAKAFDVASIMGEEVGFVTRGVGQLIRTGLVKDATEGFDLIAAAAQKLPESMQGELLETIEEYGQDFRELGFTGKQSMNVIIAGVQAGARNADLAADSFREFSDIITEGGKRPADALKAIGLNSENIVKEIRSGGPAAAKATSEVIRALGRMDDPVQRGIQGVALFGTKWLDAGETAILAMDPLKDTLGDINGKAAEVGNTLADNTATKLESFKRKVETAFVDFVGGKAIPALEKFVTWADEKFGPVWDRLAPVLETVGHAVVTLGKQAFEYILPLLKSVATWMEKNKDEISALVPWVIGLAVATKGLKVAQSVQGWMTGAIGSIKNFGTTADDTAKKIGQGGGGKFAGAAKGLAGAMAGLASAANAMDLLPAKKSVSEFDRTTSGLGDSIMGVGGAFAFTVPGMITVGIGALIKYNKELTPIAGLIGGTVISAAETAIAEMKRLEAQAEIAGINTSIAWEEGWASVEDDLPYRVNESMAQVENTLYATVPEAQKASQQTAQGWWDSFEQTNDSNWWKVPDFAGDVGQGLNARGGAFSSGADTMSGFFGGMDSRSNNTGSWVKSFGSSLVGAVKSFFDIRSPSRLMFGIGENVMAGMINGLLANNPASVIPKIFGSMPKALGSIVTKGLVPISALTSGAMSALTKLGGTFSGLFGGGGKGGNTANMALGEQLAAGMGWTGGEWAALRQLWINESGWNNNAQNPTSTAYGIAQFLNSTWASVGMAKTSDPAGQIVAGMRYIKNRYGSPSRALSFWQGNSPHWYDQGGWLMPGTTLVANHTGAPERVLGPGEVALGDGDISVTVLLDGQVIAAKTQAVVRENDSRSAYRAGNGRR